MVDSYAPIDDGGDLVAQYNGGGTVVRRFVHGASADEPVVVYEGSGTTNKSWFHADERKSIIAVTNASGVAASSVRYRPDGDSGALSSVFGYTGQLYLPELQLYYYKARMYSPKAGRFLQPDPIGHAGGMNLYSYVGNDPVNRTDPTGLCWELLLIPIRVLPVVTVVDGAQVIGQPVTRWETEWRKCLEDLGIAPDGTTEAKQREPDASGAGGTTDPQSQLPLYSLVPNHCGGGDGVRFPNIIDGVSIDPACQAHDACYDRSGRWRVTCDVLMFRDIYGLMAERDRRMLGTTVGYAYLVGVRNGGWTFYEPLPPKREFMQGLHDFMDYRNYMP